MEIYIMSDKKKGFISYPNNTYKMFTIQRVSNIKIQVMIKYNINHKLNILILNGLLDNAIKINDITIEINKVNEIDQIIKTLGLFFMKYYRPISPNVDYYILKGIKGRELIRTTRDKQEYIISNEENQINTINYYIDNMITCKIKIDNFKFINIEEKQKLIYYL